MNLLKFAAPLVLTVALGTAAAPAQIITPNEAAAVANALVNETGRATNADGFCYLSTQHPEWPPMPAAPDSSLELLRVGVGTYLVDDTHWKYPAPPPAATNRTARLQAKDDAGFTLNTNFIAANPQLVEGFKRGVIAFYPTNGLSKGEIALIQRRVLHCLAEIDLIAAHPVTNEFTVKRGPNAAPLSTSNSSSNK